MSANNYIEEKKRLIAEGSAIDARLSLLKRKSPGRAELVARKHEITARLSVLKAEARLSYNEDTISNHALIRWLERRHGIDVKRLKRAMMTDGLSAALLAGDRFWTDGNFIFVIQCGQVKTVIPFTQVEP